MRGCRNKRPLRDKRWVPPIEASGEQSMLGQARASGTAKLCQFPSTGVLAAEITGIGRAMPR